MLNLIHNFSRRVSNIFEKEENILTGTYETIMKNDNQKLLLKLISEIESEKGFSGAVKLVKAIFLIQYNSLKNQYKHSFNYRFYRWDYGPFDSSIYTDLAALENQGLIKVNQSDYGTFREKSYQITESGLVKVKELDNTFEKNLVIEMKKTGNEVNTASRGDILKKVYELADVYSYEMGDTILMSKPLMNS